MIRPLLPGTGTSTQQVPDFNEAILAPGLIWTVPAEEHNLWTSRDWRRAVPCPRHARSRRRPARTPGEGFFSGASADGSRVFFETGQRLTADDTDTGGPVSSPALFTVTVEPHYGDACLVRASGELDLSTADRLSSALDAAGATGVTTLLDLTAVSFIDLAGLRVLLRSARAVDAHDPAGLIVRASRAVRRIAELTGTTSLLPLVADSTERIATLTTAAPRRAA